MMDRDALYRSIFVNRFRFGVDKIACAPSTANSSGSIARVCDTSSGASTACADAPATINDKALAVTDGLIAGLPRDDDSEDDRMTRWAMHSGAETGFSPPVPLPPTLYQDWKSSDQSFLNQCMVNDKFVQASWKEKYRLMLEILMQV
jgi:hypothetical protein